MTSVPGHGPANALDDIRVLDLAGQMGVYGTKLLADLGADVIRVEPPIGDSVRRRGPFLDDVPGLERGLVHLYLNTSKRSVTLDIATADGQALLKRLVAGADVLVESYAPGYMASLGLSYDDLTRVRPDLIVTSITGFGQDGPHADWLAPDIVGVATSGIMTLAGWPDLPPHRPYPSQGFYCAGIIGAVSTMMAITHRDINGEGQWIDVSMQEALSMAQETAMQTWDFQKKNRKRSGPGIRLGLTGLHESADGHVYGMIGVAGAGAPLSEFIRWMDDEGAAGDLVTSGVLERMEEAAKLPRGSPGAMERLAALRENLEKVQQTAVAFFKSKTKQDLYEQGQAHGFLLGPANSPKDLVESPQLKARGYFVDVEGPEPGRTLTMPGVPYRMAESPAGVRHRAPFLGEHNVEVYEGELGLSKAELTSLKAAGVI